MSGCQWETLADFKSKMRQNRCRLELHPKPRLEITAPPAPSWNKGTPYALIRAYICRICQIFVARFRIWGGLSNALGGLASQSLPVAPGLDAEHATRCAAVLTLDALQKYANRNLSLIAT